MDTKALTERFIAATNQVIGGIRPEQLADKTPCTEWTVRDVINHLCAGGTMFAECVEQGSISDERMGQLMSSDNVGDDYKGAFKAVGKRVVSAFGQPGAMEKTVKLPFGEMPAGVALNIAVFDVTTHACDLAKATGQTVDDQELLKVALETGKQMVGPEYRQPGVLGPELQAPKGASTADQLLAFAGRAV
jgi:uncharacterized protein (TIGR03086 family)